MLQLLDMPYAHICYDQSRYCLYQTWKGSIEVDDFISAIALSVSFSNTHLVKCILSDTTDQGVLARAGTNYAASVMPDLIKNGLHKMAFVLPKSAFTRLSVESFASQSADQLVRQFTTREAAEEWLFA